MRISSTMGWFIIRSKKVFLVTVLAVAAVIYLGTLRDYFHLAQYAVQPPKDETTEQADRGLPIEMLTQQSALDTGDWRRTSDVTSTSDSIHFTISDGSDQTKKVSHFAQQTYTGSWIQDESKKNVKSDDNDDDDDEDNDDDGDDDDKKHDAENDNDDDDDSDKDDDVEESSSGDGHIWSISKPNMEVTSHHEESPSTSFIQIWPTRLLNKDARDEVTQRKQDVKQPAILSPQEQLEEKHSILLKKSEGHVRQLIKAGKPARVSLHERSIPEHKGLQSARKFRLRLIKPIPPPVGLPTNAEAAPDSLSLLLNDTAGLPTFADASTCPLLEIRKSVYHVDNSSCVLRERQPSLKDCAKASKAYDLDSAPLKCLNNAQKPLCSFKKNYWSKSRKRAALVCDTSACGKNPVFVLGLSPLYGTLEDRSMWKRFFSSKGLENFLEKKYNSVVNETTEFNFYFLFCIQKERSRLVEQIFTFPSFLKKFTEPSNSKDDFNLNILILDSVSRPHFYRSLPKTIKNLREIAHFKSYNATVLDFELLQSTASYTFHNIRALLSGKTDFGYKGLHVNETYGIDVLFGKFKRLGYFTLLQEDSCWYDSWGSLFTDNKYQGNMPENKTEFHERWQMFQEKVKTYNIDDLGLSHTSCEVLKRYNTTNQFNRPRKVCFGGKPFAEYFLEYVNRIYREFKTLRKTRILSYTHLNTGHEVTGTRIRQLDAGLSQFVKNMANTQDTLTLILSDHGPKTTKYSFHTVKGREEKYDPFFFMILPEKVARLLGLERVRNLVENQRRLITTLDLHNGLMSLGTLTSRKEFGIFGAIPKNRTCADLSMKPLAVCKCDGWDKRFPGNHKQFTWLAEFALGNINNRIQNEFLRAGKRKGGFGNCQRLSGESFTKIRRRSVGENFVTTMDLKVRPGNEIFEVQIEHPKNLQNQVMNVNFILQERITIYRHFSKCVDDTVQLGLCVCDHKQFKKTTSNKVPKWIKIQTRKDVMNIISSSRSFGAETKVKDIHEGCLLLLYRNHRGRSTTFEISNTCGDREYSVTISIKNSKRYFLSRKLPFSIFVAQRTIHFLLVIQQYGKEHHDFKLKVKHSVHYVKGALAR